MKASLKISISLNLVSFCVLVFFLRNQHKQATAPAPVSSKTATMAQAAPAPANSSALAVEPQPLHWSQLMSGKDYRAYINNLRAIGCPEPTIEDIVRGDADRAFSWERNQLGLNGSGNGPWSRAREMQLVASLLDGQPLTEMASSTGIMDTRIEEDGDAVAEATASAQSAANQARESADGEVAGTTASSPSPHPASYPLFLQNVNWSALGFTADEQAAIAQVRQQFQSEINNLNQNSGNAVNQNGATSNPNLNSASALAQWQNALQNADDQLRGLLGGQGYLAYEQQQYFAWYQPQVVAANSSGEHLTINPQGFSLK